MDNNQFYKVISGNKKVYNVEKINLECYDSKSKITFYKKMHSRPICTDHIVKKSKNVKTKKTEKVNIKNDEINHKKVKLKKNKNIYKNNTILSTVTNFNILHTMLTKLKFEKINLLFTKLKKLKKHHNHIYFFIKNSKIFLILKKTLFKHGLALLQTLVSGRFKKHVHMSHFKKFYNLIFHN